MTTQLPLRPRSHAGTDGETVASTVRRLVSEFPGRSRALVATTVVRCRGDLDGVPPGAVPELLERLARQRLLESS
ncbi:hypothetical protein ACR9E3_02780 [Actinomycetospora sp. C-140]